MKTLSPDCGEHMKLISKMYTALGLAVSLAMLSGCAISKTSEAPPKIGGDGVSDVFLAAAKQCHSEIKGPLATDKYQACVKDRLDSAIRQLQIHSDCTASINACKAALQSSCEQVEIKHD